RGRGGGGDGVLGFVGGVAVGGIEGHPGFGRPGFGGRHRAVRHFCGSHLRRVITSLDKINPPSPPYLGVFPMAWLLMYGVSSFIVIHQPWFGADQARKWEPAFEREYRRPVSDTEDLRVVAQEILKDCKMEGAFWADKPKPGVVHIDRFSFWGST